jgi:hypothetical protein
MVKRRSAVVGRGPVFSRKTLGELVLSVKENGNGRELIWNGEVFPGLPVRRLGKRKRRLLSPGSLTCGQVEINQVGEMI